MFTMRCYVVVRIRGRDSGPRSFAAHLHHPRDGRLYVMIIDDGMVPFVLRAGRNWWSCEPIFPPGLRQSPEGKRHGHG